jgi:hypothetical protein
MPEGIKLNGKTHGVASRGGSFQRSDLRNKDDGEVITHCGRTGPAKDARNVNDNDIDCGSCTNNMGLTKSRADKLTDAARKIKRW